MPLRMNFYAREWVCVEYPPVEFPGRGANTWGILHDDAITHPDTHA
jgi:hypothetical protein